ncbi:hypothetical protein JHK84_055692 [Glycine max]|nr:hypothetical protein JHK84_055692 [Glycine max]
MHIIAISLQEIQSKSIVSDIRVSLNIYLYHYEDHSLTGLVHSVMNLASLATSTIHNISDSASKPSTTEKDDGTHKPKRG